MNVVGGNGHRANSFFMSFMADVNNLVALASAHLYLMVNLGNQWADGIDHVTAT